MLTPQSQGSDKSSNYNVLLDSQSVVSTTSLLGCSTFMKCVLKQSALGDVTKGIG